MRWLFAVFIAASLAIPIAASGGTWPFAIGVATPAPTQTPVPHPTAPVGSSFIGGFVGLAPTPTPPSSGTPIPAPVFQEQNMEAFESPLPRRLAFQVQFGSEYYFSGNGSTSWCNYANCINPTDPRILGDLTYGRFPFISISANLPFSIYYSLASYLTPSEGAALGFPSNYNYESNSTSTGAWDHYTQSIATKLAAYHKPIFVRLMHEFNNCTQEHIAASGTGPCKGNGDSIYDFPALWPPSCPSWPSQTGCAQETLAEEGELFQAYWEHFYSKLQQYGATNVVLVWNPAAAGASTLTPFLPTTCYVASCTSYNGGTVFDVDYIGLDAYDSGGTNTYAGTVGSFYTAFGPSVYNLPMFLVETGAPSADVTNPANPPAEQAGCPTSYTPGATSQVAYEQSVLSQFSTYSWTGYSRFFSWSAWPNCAKDWVYDQLGIPYGKYAYYTTAGNAQFSAMSAGTPAATYTPWPTPTPT